MYTFLETSRNRGLSGSWAKPRVCVLSAASPSGAVAWGGLSRTERDKDSIVAPFTTVLGTENSPILYFYIPVESLYSRPTFQKASIWRVVLGKPRVVIRTQARGAWEFELRFCLLVVLWPVVPGQSGSSSAWGQLRGSWDGQTLAPDWQQGNPAPSLTKVTLG